MYFNLLITLIFVLLWVGIIMFLRMKKKEHFAYLIFFTIFYVYIFKVLDYTLIQFQSLIFLKFFMPGLMLNGQTAEQSINLIPLVTLTPQDLQTSLLNILLFIPFGFGLPFITNLRMKKVILMGMLFSILIECLQLITGFMANITFRVADINDLLFNTVGSAIGYMVFAGLMNLIPTTWKIAKNPILRYIVKRPR